MMENAFMCFLSRCGRSQAISGLSNARFWLHDIRPILARSGKCRESGWERQWASVQQSIFLSCVECYNGRQTAPHTESSMLELFCLPWHVPSFVLWTWQSERGRMMLLVLWGGTVRQRTGHSLFLVFFKGFSKHKTKKNRPVWINLKEFHIHIQYRHIIHVVISVSISHWHLLALVALPVVAAEKSEVNKNEEDIPGSLFTSGEWWQPASQFGTRYCICWLKLINLILIKVNIYKSNERHLA